MSNWFSNFLPFATPLKYGGDTYTTPEAFYQAMKTTSATDRTRISQMTASKAKHMGKIVDIRPDWENIKLNVMEYVQEYRCTSDPKFLDTLLSTQGDIVEWNTWHDNFWGCCQCGALTSSPYGVRNCTKGKNHLGKILMKLRDKYKGKSIYFL